MVRVWGFLWDHFWKLLSGLLVIAFTGFVAMVQTPAKVEARISNLESVQTFLRDDTLQLRIKVGTSDILFRQVDTKLDKLNESLIILSQEVRHLNKP